MHIRDGDGGGGGGGGGEEGERVKARPRIPPEKDRRDRVHWRNCCFNCLAGLSHRDSVRCTAVEEQLEAK